MASGSKDPTAPRSKGKSTPSKSVLTSKEIITDSDDLDSEDEKDEEVSEDSPDSEGDLEKVYPKKRSNAVTAPGSKTSRSLPKYIPPAGMFPSPVNVIFENSLFEYNNMMKNSDLQLWTIRVPADLKSSRLSAASLKISSASGVPAGSLKYKSTACDFSSAGSSSGSRTVNDKQARQPTAGARAADALTMSDAALRLEGGEEMHGGMRLLVPNMGEGGALVVAPIPVSQQLLLTPRLSFKEDLATSSTEPLPSFLSTSHSGREATSSFSSDVRPTPKRSQPTHLLKFRNRAYGFDTPGPVDSVDQGRITQAAVVTSGRASTVSQETLQFVEAGHVKRKSEGRSHSDQLKKKVKS